MDAEVDAPDTLDPDGTAWPSPARLVAVVVLVLVGLAGAATLVLGGDRAGGAMDSDSDPAPPVTSSSPPPERARGEVVLSPDRAPVLAGSDELVYLRSETVVHALRLGSGQVSSTVISSRPTPDGSQLLPLGSSALLLPGTGTDRGSGALVLAEGGLVAVDPVLDGSREVLPGPDGTLWLADRTGETRQGFRQVDLSGRELGGRVTAGGGEVLSDGRGGLLHADRAGLWRLGPEGRSQISPGRLIAVGQNDLLLSECGPWHYCVQVLIDQDGGERRLVPAWPTEATSLGAVSPDGSRLAVVVVRGARSSVQLLSTTERSPVRELTDQAAAAGDPAASLAWTADGEHLLVLFRGRLTVVAARDGTVQPTDLELPRLEELAVADRSAGTTHPAGSGADQ